ncbi:MAG: sensor histidine kinase, partial [Hyphomicrobiales bacterium]
AEAIQDRRESEKLLNTLDEMEEMIASVLEFTRATLLDEPLRQVDLSALLSSICDDLGDAGATVTCKVPGRTPYSCRRISLKRALVNLLDNAVKYGKRADVKLSRDDGELRITVCDDGPGIPEDQKQHVFMPFHRVESSRNADTGGIGLGLSIAQTIVHGHGGRIDLHNREPRGLAVTVHLPL